MRTLFCYLEKTLLLWYNTLMLIKNMKKFYTFAIGTFLSSLGMFAAVPLSYAAAPIISEVTPVTTPTSDTTPSYTFTTNKAGTITYGGSCSSSTNTDAVVGNNTITFDTTVTTLSHLNPLVDATYSDCTIKVTDATDNESDVLNITDFVVETGAPTISEATPINPSTSDTTPNYVFNSNESGTIIYEGSCSSTTTNGIIGNNLITFNALSPGTYSDCKIKITDPYSNESNTLNVNTFIIKDIPTINRVTGTIEDGSSITISGADFGYKSVSAPLRRDNFGENAEQV